MSLLPICIRRLTSTRMENNGTGSLLSDVALEKGRLDSKPGAMSAIACAWQIACEKQKEYRMHVAVRMDGKERGFALHFETSKLRAQHQRPLYSHDIAVRIFKVVHLASGTHQPKPSTNILIVTTRNIVYSKNESYRQC